MRLSMNENFKIKDIILILLVLILLVSNITILLNIMELNQQKTDVKVNTVKEEKNDENTLAEEEEVALEKLKASGERDRMESYFSKFISYIESKDYQKAYDVLYPEFRDTYFKTLDEFKEYVDKTYPNLVAFSYNDIERQGYIYVLILDILDLKNNTKKSQRIVIQENDFNDFVISFQVI